MTPELFAQAIVSIEQNYGLRLDARSVWLRMDAIACGRGWVGTKPGCKRAGKVTADQPVKVPVKVPKIKTPEIKPNESEVLKSTLHRLKTKLEESIAKDKKPEVNVGAAKDVEAKKENPDEQKPIEANGKRLTSGKHTDIPSKKIAPSDRESYRWSKDEKGVERYYRVEAPSIGKEKETEITRKELSTVVKERFNGNYNLARAGVDLRPEAETKKIEEREEGKQIAAVQKLTGLSADEAKSSIKAIGAYTNIDGESVSDYGSIRNVQRGILKAADGRDLTKSEISEINSSIKSIDQYVKKMPAFEGQVHRGMSFDSKEQQEAFLSKISGGYSLEAMSSFSSSKRVAKEFAMGSKAGILFTVKNKSGASVKRLSLMEEEDEIIVPKDIKYRIVGTPKRSGKVVIVQMEEY